MESRKLQNLQDYKISAKLSKPTLVGAQFFRQNTWFLENNRALPNFLHGILHYLISITKIQKNQSIEHNFIILTMQATLMI